MTNDDFESFINMFLLIEGCWSGPWFMRFERSKWNSRKLEKSANLQKSET